jgi:hypothetical protein
MKVRQHLRLWTAVSLVVQSAWLFAIVPADCCAAHTPHETERSCHEEVQAMHCPMKDSTGAACPMHQADKPHPSSDDCRMSGGCAGPMSALLSLLAAHAVLPETPVAVISAPAVAHPSSWAEQLASRFVPPDAPPPRA